MVEDNHMVKSVEVLVLNNFIENILNDKNSESGDSCDQDLTVSQENVVEYATNIGDNISHNEDEKFVDTDAENLNGEKANGETSSYVREEIPKEAEEDT